MLDDPVGQPRIHPERVAQRLIHGLQPRISKREVEQLAQHRKTIGLPASRFGERHIRVRSEDLERLFRPIPAGLSFTRCRRA